MGVQTSQPRIETADELQRRLRAAMRLLSVMIVLIFLIEFIIDLLLHHGLADLTSMAAGLADGFVSILAIYPILYFAIYRPLTRYISERRRVEEALRESEERYRKLVDLSPYAIAVHSEGEVVFVNRAGAKLLAAERPEEIVGRPLMDFVHSDYRAIVTERVRLMGEEGAMVPLIEEKFVRLDGTPVDVEVAATSISYCNKPGMLVVVGDITERKQMEEQLRRAQRLEMAGRIAGQVAHDFNNLLSPLVAYPELIKMELPEDHPALVYCDTMLKATQQMADINEDLMTLARRGHFNQVPTNLNHLIEQTMAQIPPAPASLKVHLDLEKSLLPVDISPSQLSRVISNLIANAREAMRDDGLLQVKTANVYVDRALSRYNRVEVGEYVKLDVSDSGSGISEEVLDKIFDPFFTTKQTDRRRGSGLGLSVVQVIVDDHKGYVDVESEIGKGTTFSVYLPVYRGDVTEVAGGDVKKGGETVLVVDDDQVQRDVLRRLLNSLGYKASTVASGEEAVAFLQANAVDLLILDMIMEPGIDGAETYRRALGMRPQQRAIIISGYAESERVKEAQALGAGAYVRKPVTIAGLAQAVREELDRVYQTA